jgi:membrane associated rhomboid family serine protease
MLYLASGVLANSWTFLAGTSSFSLGASGCILALIGAFTSYYYFNCHILGRMSELALNSIKNTMVMNLILHENIDNWTHIKGFTSISN